uniref:PDZ domain-containing protein n=1 Tax=Rhizochromulina marina TaxID=1034831 RepID=A0A7S2W194_9STRA
MADMRVAVLGSKQVGMTLATDGVAEAKGPDWQSESSGARPTLVVDSLEPDSELYVQGIRPGDRLLSIDGSAVGKDLSTDEVMAQLVSLPRPLELWFEKEIVPDLEQPLTGRRLSSPTAANSFSEEGEEGDGDTTGQRGGRTSKKKGGSSWFRIFPSIRRRIGRKASWRKSQAAAEDNEVSALDAQDEDPETGTLMALEAGGELDGVLAPPSPMDAGKQMYDLACRYRLGEGVEQDTQLSIEFLARAADAGYPPAQVALGNLYENDPDLSAENVEKTAQLYQAAADKGNHKALFFLGKLCLSGKGVKEDQGKGVELLRRAADSGIAEAHFKLAELYDHGIFGLDQSEAKAVQHVETAADLGLVAAQYELGHRFANGQGIRLDYRRAATYFLRAASQGDADAQYDLAQLYAKKGHILLKTKDPKIIFERVVKFCMLAAEQAHPQARCDLAALFMNGSGVPRNEKTAIKLYKLAAAQGNAQALCNLGVMYEMGRGVKKSRSKAIKYYTYASELGSDDALWNLEQLMRYTNPDEIDDPPSPPPPGVVAKKFDQQPRDLPHPPGVAKSPRRGSLSSNKPISPAHRQLDLSEQHFHHAMEDPDTMNMLVKTSDATVDLQRRRSVSLQSSGIGASGGGNVHSAIAVTGSEPDPKDDGGPRSEKDTPAKRRGSISYVHMLEKIRDEHGVKEERGGGAAAAAVGGGGGGRGETSAMSPGDACPEAATRSSVSAVPTFTTVLRSCIEKRKTRLNPSQSQQSQSQNVGLSI